MLNKQHAGIIRSESNLVQISDVTDVTSLQYTMFKLVVFLVCIASALSQGLDETPAGERAVEKEPGAFQDVEEGEMFIERDEHVDEDEMPEGSSEGKAALVFYQRATQLFSFLF